MKRAKELGVTVLLSGQGADELLLGYQSDAVRHVARLIRQGNLVETAHNLAGFLRHGTVIRDYRFADIRHFVARRVRTDSIDIGGPLLKESTSSIRSIHTPMDISSREVEDLYRGSIPAILHSEDRMSMAWSREIRAPFLDYRLVSLLHALPGNVKLRDGWTKWILRNTMEPLLPPAIAWGKDKQGFVSPERERLQDGLRPVISSIVNALLVTGAAGIIDQNELRRWYAHYYAGSGGYRAAFWREALLPVALGIWACRFERYLRW
jgi:asparagine synthase (glutamine-hydrolysing)